MEKALLFSIMITVLFLAFKFAEGYYLEKEERPLKFVLRDAIMVFLSSLTVLFAMSHFEGYIQDFIHMLTGVNKAPEKALIFTGEPEF
jgi:heme/copper-type cytochrome/quinol oxidase subunit 3